MFGEKTKVEKRGCRKKSQRRTRRINGGSKKGRGGGEAGEIAVLRNHIAN